MLCNNKCSFDICYYMPHCASSTFYWSHNVDNGSYKLVFQDMICGHTINDIYRF